MLLDAATSGARRKYTSRPLAPASSKRTWPASRETKRCQGGVEEPYSCAVTSPDAGSAKVSRDDGRVRLGVVFFHALLILFAADAERRLGAGLETFDRDLFAALFAGAEAAIFDLV